MKPFLDRGWRGAGAIRGRGSGKAKAALSLKTTVENLYYLLFTFCAAFLHVNASHCMFWASKPDIALAAGSKAPK